MNDSSLSKQQQVLATIRRHIATGEWPAGHRVPSPPDLAKRWGVSKSTVDNAIGILVATGELVAHRGLARWVPPMPEQATGDISVDSEDNPDGPTK